MPCRFSIGPFAALLGSDSIMSAVVIPQSPGSADSGPTPVPPPELLVQSNDLPPGLIELAWANRIPVFRVGQMASPELVDVIAGLRPDFLVVACFPRRLPRAVISLPRIAGLNVHPSLLPDYRGPDPLFWQFRNGETRTGVTIHLLEETFDTGHIVLQEAIDIPEDIDGGELEQNLSKLGGRLLVEAIDQLAAGKAKVTPQGPGGSYHSRPLGHDFVFGIEQSASELFRVIRGVRGLGYPAFIEGDGWAIVVDGALEYTPEGRLDAAIIRQGDTADVQCRPGVLRVRLMPGSS